MGTSLLILGKADSPSRERNALRMLSYALEAGIDAQWADYHELDSIRDFRNDTAVVLFFFPYRFWNACCESPGEGELYGASYRIPELLNGFFMAIGDEIRARFKAHHLQFFIPPEIAAMDRDKSEVIRRLRACGVPVSTTLEYGYMGDILEAVESGNGVIIKCRYGSEGKGITLLRRSCWLTNYRVDDGRLANYGVYDLWKFTEITGRRDLLRQLLDSEVIVEEEIVPPSVYPGRKFDVRCYTVNCRSLHFCTRLGEPGGIVTNYSQGGTVIHDPKTGLPADMRLSLLRTGEEASKALSLNLLGVDMIVEDQTGMPKVIEVQVFADFPHIGWFDLARYLVEEGLGLTA